MALFLQSNGRFGTGEFDRSMSILLPFVEDRYNFMNFLVCQSPGYCQDQMLFDGLEGELALSTASVMVIRSISLF